VIRRGEGGAERKGGPLWSPVGMGALMLERSEMTMATGDHKGPPHPTSSALASTDSDGLFLRLMSLGRPVWSLSQGCFCMSHGLRNELLSLNTNSERLR
jgi:hypothetical protein